MPKFIAKATRIEAAGNKPKLIDEYVGRVNSSNAMLSIAHMRSPEGWMEPGQTPDFDEYTIVLKGTLRVDYRDGVLDVSSGQAVLCEKGEWVRYSTPGTRRRRIHCGMFTCILRRNRSPRHRDLITLRSVETD